MRHLISFVLFIAVLAGLLRAYTSYKTSAAPVPPGVLLAGFDFQYEKDPAQIQATLERTFVQPIAVYYNQERLVLRPEEIDFTLDVQGMLADAEFFLHGDPFVELVIRQVLGLPPQVRELPLRYGFNQVKLEAWLQAAAQRFDRGPQPARVLPPDAKWASGAGGTSGLPPGYVGTAYTDWRWVVGASGYTLDAAASSRQIQEALTRVQERNAYLVLNETPATTPTIQDLAQALNSYTADFPGFAAIYVEDLITDQVGTVDADVSFSGMSTLKIILVSALFQRLDGMEKPEIGQWMDYALGESSNFAANLMLRWLGDGDIYAGAQAFTEFARQLGLENTYMQTGYDDKSQRSSLPTPGNQRDDWNTDPDTHLQSTPEDMGRMLAAIYDCTEGAGLLMERFPDDFTPQECQHILFYMSHDHFRELIWGGLPEKEQSWIVHKHGFAFESHSDVALVWGPTGPYVLSIFLYRPGWLDWNTSNGAMRDISRITWRFFEFKQQLMQTPSPTPMLLEPPPNYLPVVQTGPAQ